MNIIWRKSRLAISLAFPGILGFVHEAHEVGLTIVRLDHLGKILNNVISMFSDDAIVVLSPRMNS